MLSAFEGVFDRVLGVVAWICVWAIVFLMAMLALVLGMQVFARYVLNRPLTWSEELARYMFVWIVFLSAWATFRERRHLGMDFLVRRFSPWWRGVADRLVEALILVFVLIVISAAPRMLSIAGKQTSAALGIPMNLVYLAFPTGSVLTALEILRGWITLGVRSLVDAQVELPEERKSL